MADRFPTEIEISGRLTEDQLHELCERAVSEGLSADWENCFQQDWLEEKLREQIKQGSPFLTLSATEMCPGDEAPFTEWLIEQKLAWNKWVSAKYEYDAGLTWWRPGMKCHRSWDEMDAGAKNVMVSVSTLKNWLAKKRTLKWVVAYLTKIPPRLPKLRLCATSRGGAKRS